MVKISVLFDFLVVLAVLAENALAGYEYGAPRATGADAQQAHFNSAQQWQRFLPSQVYPQADDVNRNQYRQTQQQAQYYQSSHSDQSSYQNVNYNRHNQNFGNVNLLDVHNAQQIAQANPAYNPTYANTQAQRPVITKHIYFHLAPPDETVTAAPVTATPPKKIYNIIFIKLPAQKYASAPSLQQLINRQVAIENKTLVYVLVKKPETQPLQPVTSKPEVFFVKYKEPRNIGRPANNGLVQVPVLHSSNAALLPGLVNGHGN